MKRLIKYISKEFFGPFLMGIFGFVIFVSVELLYQLSDKIVRNKSDLISFFFSSGIIYRTLYRWVYL